jgi:hypothetical protein
MEPADGQTEPPPASRGRPIRVCESLPPVVLVMEPADGQTEPPPASRGRPIRVCESLPPVVLVMEEVPPALVLQLNGDPATRAEIVADALLKAVAHDRAAGGSGFTRDRSREVPQPGTFTLVLVPNGPIGPDTEPRLREVAAKVAAPGVSVEVMRP